MDIRSAPLLLLLTACSPTGTTTAPVSSDVSPVRAAPEAARPDGRYDAQTQLVWAHKPGAPVADWEGAKTWCEEQPDGPWRLPSKWELRSMLTPDKFEYRADFADFAKLEGYIFSAEQVSEERPGQPWMLNLRNGAIFNGDGYEAMPWCVSGAPHTWTSVQRPETYDATILGAPGGVEIELTCQFDNIFCKRTYDRLAKLGDAVHVRLRHIIPPDTLYERQVMACAAAVQGKLPRMAQMLFANAKIDPEVEDVYVYAEHLGLDMARVEADAKSLCPRIMQDDQEELRTLDRPPLRGTPAAYVNGVHFDGKQIGEGALEKLVR